MKKIIKSSLVLLALGACIGYSGFLASKNSDSYLQTFAKDKMVSGNDFISVGKFLTSGKGVTLEFTYTKPSSNTDVNYCFMDVDNGWHRLTTYLKFSFKSDGSVSTNLGKVFSKDEHHYYQIMFSELKDYLNKSSGEEADGSETLNGFYLPNNPIEFNVLSAQIITTDTNAYPFASIREDNIHGLTFKGYIPKLISGASYGMCIVPSSYLKDAKDNYIN